MTSPLSYFAQQLADVQAQIADLKGQRVSYMRVPVVSTDTASNTFGASIPNQATGGTVTLTGITTPAKFMPNVADTVTLAVSGAQLIYQPTQIATGAIDVVNLSPNAPLAPTSLSLTTGTTVAADGTTHGIITATWTPPTNTVGGAPIVGALTFVVQSRATGTTNWSARTSATTTSVLSGATPGISFDVRVAAQDQLSNLGAFTAVSAITTGQDSTAPGTPSTPTVGNYLGQLKITWDGLLGGSAPPTDFAYLEVHVSATTGFTPSSATLVSNLSAKGSAFATATYGTTMFAKFVAVDTTGNKSTASAQGSGSTSGVVSADIVAGAVGTAALANLAVTTAALAAGAVDNAKLATAAVDTANIVNLAVGTAQMANLAVSSAKIANLAVGTAQIANLAVNDAQVANMSVGKLTAGTMTVDVVMGGRFATALTGARVEMNSTGFQKFDSGGNLIVSITGTTTLLQGNFKTASTGRRIEINSAGATGSIDFYSPSGQDSYVVSYTEPNSPFFESIQMSMNVGGHYLWNAINIDTIPQIAYHSSWHEFGMTAGGTGFQIGTYTSSASFSTGLVYRFKINSAGINYARPNAAIALQIIEGATNNRITFVPTGIGNGGLDILDNAANTSQSARVMFSQQNGTTSIIKGFAGDIELRTGDDLGFTNVHALSYIVGSDQDTKTNIQDATIDGLAAVRGMRVRSYNRVHGNGQQGPTEIGLVAQEAPAQIVSTHVDSSGHQGIDAYQYTTLLAAGLKQGIAALDALTARVTTLEGKVP